MWLSSLLLDANAWVAEHAQLLTLIGIPTITFFVSWLANRSAEKRSSQQRKIERLLATELKLVDFRQAWINELRDQLAEFVSLTSAKMVVSTDYQEISRRANKIVLLLNPGDPEFSAINNLLVDLVEKTKLTMDHRGAPADALLNLSQRLLKREWERLKSDLAKVEGFRAQ